MGNLSKKVDSLFRQYLIRKEKESHVVYNYSSYRPHNNWMDDRDDYDGVIYFYEWSDVNRPPQLFYKVGAFDQFLRRCSIFMPPYQKDIIRQLDRVYVTCKKGSHDLLIRGSRPLLLDAVGADDSPGVDLKTATEAVLSKVPAPATPPPPMFPAYGGARQSPMYNDTPEWW